MDPDCTAARSICRACRRAGRCNFVGEFLTHHFPRDPVLHRTGKPLNRGHYIGPDYRLDIVQYTVLNGQAPMMLIGRF